MTGDFIFSGQTEPALKPARPMRRGATGGRPTAAFFFAGPIPSRGICAKTASLPTRYVNRQR